MRDSLNLSMSEPLRRANVRPRLAALADQTGFAATQIAGRALTLGLRLIESDLRLLFPASDPSSLATPSAPVQRPAHAETAAASHAPPCAAMQSADAQRSPAPSAGASQIAPLLDEQPDPASRPEASAEAARIASASHGGISTREAAHALGYRNEAAFRQHCQRHRDLFRFSTKSGRALVWDLDGLRAEYLRLGFALKGQALDEQQAHHFGAAEAPTA